MDGRTASEDAAMVALGNALLLAMLVEFEERRRRVRGLRVDLEASPAEQIAASQELHAAIHGEASAERRAVPEFFALLDALTEAGALDLRINPLLDLRIIPASQAWNEEVRLTPLFDRVNPCRERHEDFPGDPARCVIDPAMLDLAHSGADIATLRLRDFSLPFWLEERPDVQGALAERHPRERRQPLVGLGSTPLTRALAGGAIGYFRGELPEAPASEPREGLAAAGTAGGSSKTAASKRAQEDVEMALRNFAKDRPSDRILKNDFIQWATCCGVSKTAAPLIWANALSGTDWVSPGRRRNMRDAACLSPYLKAVQAARRA